MLTVALSGLLSVLLALTFLWMLSLRLRDPSIIDSFWGPGFALATLIYYLVDGSRASRGTLVLLLVTTWAARLGYHLLRRNRRLGEDPRYAAVFLVGLGLESLADHQLTRFRADPADKGRVLESGLWRYSRHPNYFGDTVVWWGLYAVAAGAGAYWTILRACDHDLSPAQRLGRPVA